MLNRNAFSSGAYLDSFDSLPTDLKWSREQIEQSLCATLSARTGMGDVWVFAYGSLIWNPLADFVERRAASLHGWHRSFCLKMIAGRGSPEVPGRMLALEPGGTTSGVAFKLDAAVAIAELRMMWIREMVTGSYSPIWASITLDDGTSAPAIVFVANPDRPQYQVDSSVESIAPIVAAASGPFGSNADYVFKLSIALLELGIDDTYITSLAASVSRIAPREAG